MFTHKTFADGSEWTPMTGVAAIGLSIAGAALVGGTVVGVKRIGKKIKKTFGVS